MSNEIRIGFSMHPRWADQGELEIFVRPLRQAGLSALEFELDDRLDLWPEFQPLMQTATEQGLDLSFHAPYRAPRTLIGFSSDRRPVLEQEYRPLLEIAEKWAQQTGKEPTLVVHAAVSMPPADPQALIADTTAYLNWVAANFPHLRLALENNHPPTKNEVKVGIQREDVLKLAGCLPPERLGICWDMGHDYLRHTSDEPSPEWLARVIHVHVHDVDDADNDHYPLTIGNVPYPGWLKSLKQTGMKGIVVLELKGERMMNWPIERIQSALTDSVAAIAEAIA
jgi:sugar phosphate isomerase/epimerase